MNRNQAGLSLLLTVSVIGLLAFIIGAGAWVFYHDNEPLASTESSADCEVSDEMKATKLYDVPCEIGITVKSPTQTTINEINQIIDPINGTVTDPMPDIGVYWIRVKAGTEKKSVEYLKSQPEVLDAAQNHCCAQPN